MAEFSETSTLNTNPPPGLSPSTTPELPTAESSFDEYTLCAYGDISLTNTYFVPGLPSDSSLRRLDQEPEMRPKCTLPAAMPQVSSYLVERRRPNVIQNILPVSPTKPVISDDFEKLVENLRPRHESAKLTPENSSPTKVLSPRPRHANNLRVIEKSRDIPKSPQASRLPLAPRAPGAALPSAPIAITRPKPKEKPLRGYAKLPPRPPIPRWDLLDSAVYGGLLEKCQAS